MYQKSLAPSMSGVQLVQGTAAVPATYLIIIYPWIQQDDADCPQQQRLVVLIWLLSCAAA